MISFIKVCLCTNFDSIYSNTFGGYIYDYLTICYNTMGVKKLLFYVWSVGGTGLVKLTMSTNTYYEITLTTTFRSAFDNLFVQVVKGCG